MKHARHLTLATLVVLTLAVSASAQTLAPRRDPLAFETGSPTQDTGWRRPDTLDTERPLGVAFAARGGESRPFTLAAADSRVGEGGRGGAAPSEAPDQDAELAKKLQNPVADLISVPIQNNWDFGIGPADAMRYTANIQPVIPFSLTKNWNLITRTIMPVIYAEAPVPGGDATAGMGDILQSFFFSPKQPTRGGWIWAIGPVFLYPSATDDALGAEKFALGPTAAVLKQSHGWTYGLLANHIWSVAGNGDRDAVNATFIQPVVSYTTKTLTTFGFVTETSYDWEHEQATVPLNWTVQQLVNLGGQRVAFQLGVRYYAEKPEGGPDWGLRFVTTLLFPR